MQGKASRGYYGVERGTKIPEATQCSETLEFLHNQNGETSIKFLPINSEHLNKIHLRQNKGKRKGPFCRVTAAPDPP